MNFGQELIETGKIDKNINNKCFCKYNQKRKTDLFGCKKLKKSQF